MPPPNATLYQQVLERLGKDICGGRFPPGSLLPVEPELCEQLGVSRIVVREAVKGLASKGLVESRRRVGTIVLAPARWSLFDPEVVTWRAEARGLDPSLGHDLMELRRIVEPAAARLAAQRASAADREDLRAAYDAMARAVAGDGPYVAADLAFHGVILRACANPFVEQLQAVLATALRIGFERVAETPGGPASSLPMHRAVCDAIGRGDADAAERAALVLIDRADADLKARLRETPTRPTTAGRMRPAPRISRDAAPRAARPRARAR
jgi:DNA-binding FadR family transcriptional regulator